MTLPRNDGRKDLADEARTPPELFRKLDERFHFDIDVAANEDNTLCMNFFATRFQHVERKPHEIYKVPLDYNALELDWSKFKRYGTTTFFCNPPYSRGNIPAFTKKAYEESLKGATVVMLLPADTSTKTFHEYCMKASEIIFLHPRVRFLHPETLQPYGSPQFGSMAVVFRNEDFDGSPVISSMRWKDEK